MSVNVTVKGVFPVAGLGAVMKFATGGKGIAVICCGIVEITVAEHVGGSEPDIIGTIGKDVRWVLCCRELCPTASCGIVVLPLPGNELAATAVERR